MGVLITIRIRSRTTEPEQDQGDGLEVEAQSQDGPDGHCVVYCVARFCLTQRLDDPVELTISRIR